VTTRAQWQSNLGLPGNKKKIQQQKNVKTLLKNRILFCVQWDVLSAELEGTVPISDL